MKVLMVADSICGNGIGVVVNRLYHSLNERGIQCDIVCYQDKKEYESVFLEIENDGNHIFSIPGVSKGIYAYIKNIRRICKNGNYDVIHIHTSLMIFLAAYAAKKENIKVRIGHAHGAKFFNYSEWFLKVLEPLGRFLNRRFCTNFVTCSQDSAKYTFGKDAIFMPNYVPVNDIMEVSKKNIEILKKEFDEECILFGYMGNLDGTKNVIFLPEVIAELNKMGIDAKLILIGQGNEMNNIKNKVIELQCENDVIFLGKKENCNELVQTFDYYLSASKTEGMSLSMVEAQMSGKPCIVSAMIPDYSDLHIGLFRKIEGFNAKQWASVISKWISDGYNSISREKAYGLISKNRLTENEIIDDLIKIYSE